MSVNESVSRRETVLLLWLQSLRIGCCGLEFTIAAQS
jgi:hypothetical protein